MSQHYVVRNVSTGRTLKQRYETLQQAEQAAQRLNDRKPLKTDLCGRQMPTYLPLFRLHR